jgi:metallo-beta-lactamase family protein
MPTLTFLGAARTVTGSKYLLALGDHRVLIDAGLFQGLKELRERNWRELPVVAASIDAIVLTHAHLDHVGYLPRLVAQGFHGRIFCTPGTADLCRLVLPDSGKLQEEDARYANKHGYSRHKPALPLYTLSDAWRTLTQLQPVGYARSVPVLPGIEVTFTPAGHLLGSAFVSMTLSHGRRLVFGGDLGRYDRPILPDPVRVAEADVLLCESTYGDRVHEPDGDGEKLAAIVRDTIGRGGKVIIPAFAIGRVEEVLYWLRQLEAERRIPTVPVYLDSPMAIEALQFYGNRTDELDADMRRGSRETAAFLTKRFEAVASPKQSKAVTASSTPSIIISASGMATGGRVLHHLVQGLPDPRYTVTFVGFQAPGTRGRDLCDGAAAVKIHGQVVPVRAAIQKLDSLSSHADSTEILRWLRGFSRPPDVTYLVHGEPGPMEALRTSITKELGWNSRAPEYLETVNV